MLQMADVIGDQELNGHGLIVTDKAKATQAIRGDRRSDVKKVEVVCLPKRNETLPRFGLIALSTDPFCLFVLWQFDFAAELSSHESLMIVACRIDEVAEDFFLRPFVGGTTDGTVSLGDGKETWQGHGHDRLEFHEDVVHSRLSFPDFFSDPTGGHGKHPEYHEEPQQAEQDFGYISNGRANKQAAQCDWSSPPFE